MVLFACVSANAGSVCVINYWRCQTDVSCDGAPTTGSSRCNIEMLSGELQRLMSGGYEITHVTPFNYSDSLDQYIQYVLVKK